MNYSAAFPPECMVRHQPGIAVLLFCLYELVFANPDAKKNYPVLYTHMASARSLSKLYLPSLIATVQPLLFLAITVIGSPL